MKKIIITLALLSSLLFSEEQKESFTLTDINNTVVVINHKNEKIVVKDDNKSVLFLLFFGHNCKPCLNEIPEVKALQDKNHKDLKILAFDIHGYNEKDLKKFQDEKKINYPLFTREDNKKFIAYIKAKTKWRGSLPFMVVFNKEGDAKLAHKGALNFKKLETIYKAVK